VTENRVTQAKVHKVKSQRKRQIRRPRKIKRRNLRRRVSGATNNKKIKATKKTNGANKTVDKKKKRQDSKTRRRRYNQAIERWLLKVLSSDPDYQRYYIKYHPRDNQRYKKRR
jgi:hypothetical protein